MIPWKCFGEFVNDGCVVRQAADDDVSGQVGRVDDIAELLICATFIDQNQGRMLNLFRRCQASKVLEANTGIRLFAECGGDP